MKWVGYCVMKWVGYCVMKWVGYCVMKWVSLWWYCVQCGVGGWLVSCEGSNLYQKCCLYLMHTNMGHVAFNISTIEYMY